MLVKSGLLFLTQSLTQSWASVSVTNSSPPEEVKARNRPIEGTKRPPRDFGPTTVSATLGLCVPSLGASGSFHLGLVFNTVEFLSITFTQTFAIPAPKSPRLAALTPINQSGARNRQST
ncbi:hypothetical protein V8F20_004409 [Naviculisporaceae sp. PSN 640]